MGHFSIRWHPRGRGQGPGASRAERSDSKPPPVPAGGPPAGGPRLPSERLLLYGSSALVVLIVIVIIILATAGGRGVLAYMPKGQRTVHAIDIRRYFRSAAYDVLEKAEHESVKSLERSPRVLGIHIREDLAHMATVQGQGGDRGLLLFGRFSPQRVRSEFEEEIEDLEPGAALEIKTREVRGREYAHYPKKNNDRAVATLGSSVAAYGSGRFVRRVLKVRAGLYDGLLGDKDVASAYDSSRASGAFVWRLERAPGKELAHLLALVAKTEKDKEEAKDKKKAKAPGPTAAVLALEASGEATAVMARIAMKDPKGAEALKKRIDATEALAAVREYIGAAEGPKTAVADRCVVLQATVSRDAFAAIVSKHKKKPGEVSNLILNLMTGG